MLTAGTVQVPVPVLKKILTAEAVKVFVPVLKGCLRLELKGSCFCIKEYAYSRSCKGSCSCIKEYAYSWSCKGSCSCIKGDSSLLCYSWSSVVDIQVTCPTSNLLNSPVILSEIYNLLKKACQNFINERIIIRRSFQGQKSYFTDFSNKSNLFVALCSCSKISINNQNFICRGCTPSMS